jgi:hypothetical protein
MATAAEWSTGYARQADADFKTFEALQPLPVPECHKLHFLQMACEKLVKAHLCSSGTDPAQLQGSHAFIRKHLPTVLRQVAALVNFTGPQATAVLRRARQIAQEIDVLAPAVKRGGQRPDNCEYPWEDSSGTLHVPIDSTFPPTQLLLAPAGRTVLKLLRLAINRFLP